MFWYHFLWCVGTHHYPVNYFNPFLNEETNNLYIRAFWKAKDTIMFHVKEDLPFND